MKSINLSVKKRYLDQVRVIVMELKNNSYQGEWHPILEFNVPLKILSHETLCYLHKMDDVTIEDPEEVAAVFDYHYDKVKITKVMIENEVKEHG